MQRNGKNGIGLAIVWALAGCTAQGHITSDGPSLALELERHGDALALVEAPAATGYRPMYPNAEDMDRMVVGIDRAGDLTTSCEYAGHDTPCSASPFHTRRGERGVEVWDVYGMLVARLGSADAADPADPADPAGREPEGSGEPTREDRLDEAAVSAFVGDITPSIDLVRGRVGATVVESVGDLAVRGSQNLGQVQLELGSGTEPFTAFEREAEDEPPASGDAPATDFSARLYITTGRAESLSTHVAVIAGSRHYTADARGRVGETFGAVLVAQVADDPARSVTTVDFAAVWPDGSWLQVRVSYDTENGGPAFASGEAPAAPSWNEFQTGCANPAAKAVFCDAMSRELAVQGVADYAVDCSGLPNNPAVVPRASVFGDTTVILDGCNTVIGPAQDVVTGTLSGGGTLAETVCGNALAATWGEAARQDMRANGICSGSPIILDLSGDGIALSTPDDGAPFDLLGTGEVVSTAWPTSGDDAFLVIDLDRDGAVAGASELFGNFTAGNTYEDGFQPLAALDENGDGQIDAEDPAFASLLIWRDGDRDGMSRPAELSTPNASGIASFGVRSERVEGEESLDAHGNSLPLVGTFRWLDGEQGHMADAFLRYRAIETMHPALSRLPIAVSVCVGPDLR